MNELSWIIYLAEVLPNLAGIATVISVFSIIILIFRACFMESLDSLFWLISAPSILFILLLALIPTKETFYLIAASQFGEMALENETMKVTLEELHRTILYQLKLMQGEG